MTSSRAAARASNRSSLLFLAGLLIASAVAISFDGMGAYILQSGRSSIPFDSEEALQPLPPRPLSAADRAAAETAWRYFETNTRAETGLVDSVAGFPSTTLWDQGSYLLGLSAAEALGIIPQAEFETRATRILDALARLPLVEGKLPNKAYDTRSLAMVDYDNTPAPGGIGWSALDVGRMLLALRVLERRAPTFGPRIRSLLARWDLDALTEHGELIGARRGGAGIEPLQEGRIGYEQYAARAAALWGLDVAPALSAQRILAWQEVLGVPVPRDRRSADAFGAITPTLSEPYMLQGLELGFDSEGAVLASRIYLAQEARFAAEGIETMVSEDHLDRPPSFVYASVIANGEPWAVVTEDGGRYPELRTLSTKAVFAWDALYGRPYTARLRARIEPLASGDGWYAGIYEASGEANDVLALNTNAVILEALHFKAFGPLWQIR